VSRSRSTARLAALLVPSVVLVSCASLPGAPPAPGIDPELVWSTQRQRLQEVRAWDLSGRISVTGPDGSWSARIQWTQREDAYDIYFMTPLGQRMALLEGGHDGVTLRFPDREPVQAATAEELLQTSFGWSAPVAALRYWILGTPEPRQSAATRLDGRGRLQQLEQDGWRIEYPQYAAVSAAVGELPRKLNLDGPPLRIRLVVDSWALEE